MNVLKLGKVSIDGTKVQANASKHKALSYGHASKLENLLEARGGGIAAQGRIRRQV